jgi:hypothetical protein
MVGDLTSNHDKAMKDMLLFDMVRGTDSTGLLAVSRHSNNTKIVKKPVNGADFLDFKQTSDMFTIANRVYLGHNRAATKGKINALNAHPFHHGSIIGAHNGTLHNQSLLPESSRFEVDSENIIFALSQMSVQNTVSNLQGAYALAWWNEQEETINFLRNSDRTFFIARSDDNKSLFWASESWMIWVATSRHGIKIGDILPLPEHTHFSLKVDGGYMKKEDVLPDAILTPVEPRKAPLVVYGGNSATSVQGNTLTKTANETGKTEENKSSRASGRRVVGALNLLGYELDEPVDFQPATIDSQGRILGVTLDQNGIDVYMVCEGGKAEAESWMTHEGVGGNKFFVTADKLRGFSATGGHGGRGALYVNSKDCSLVEYPNYNKYTTISTEADNDDNRPFTDTDTESTKTKAPVLRLKGVKYKGEVLTRAQFEKSYKVCAWCSDPLRFTDPGMRIISTQDALCGACTKNPEVKQYMH